MTTSSHRSPPPLSDVDINSRGLIGYQGTDLSIDEPSDSDVTAEFNAQAKLYNQRHDQRQTLFWLAILAAGLMTLCFIVFVFSAVCWMWIHPEKQIDWHILLLGSALIVPPTLVAWNLMKQVFRSDGKLENGKNDDGGSGVLFADVVKELIDVIKDWVSKK